MPSRMIQPFILSFQSMTKKHELFIITSSNEVDSNWLRERLDMQHMKSYKTGKISKSNVIDIKDVRHALQDSNTKS